MSILLRLLTTGKSLVGVRDEVHRYRTANRRVLPCFGSGKNPFQNSSETAGAQPGLNRAAPAETETSSSGSKRPEGRRSFFSSSGKPATKSGAVPAAVQGELSLDRVQVVRNDLSDVDLEIVPLRSAVKARPTPAEPKITAPTGEPARFTRMTNRLFGLLKT